MWLVAKIIHLTRLYFSIFQILEHQLYQKLISKDVTFLEFYKSLPYIYFITCYINDSGKFFQIDLEIHLIIVFCLNRKKWTI